MNQRKRAPKSKNETGDHRIRLQKVLASHGSGSRRSCEQLILDGRVEVDGQVVDQLGVRVDPEKQKITLDGERLSLPKLQYFMLNKPAGVVSTAKDPAGRIRVIDLIKSDARVYNVGRLDKSSEGLILVTNDGDLANSLTHPRFGVEKKYHVLIAGRPDPEKLKQLKRGIQLAEAQANVLSVRIRKTMRDSTWLEMVLAEGRNREIRRLLAKIGHKVMQLRRVAIGPLPLGELPVGAYRPLTDVEVRKLKAVARKPASAERSSNASSHRKRSVQANKSRKISRGTAQAGRATKKPATGRPGRRASSKRRKSS